MFNHRYFGRAYLGNPYFGDGIGAVAPMTVYAVVSFGSYEPDQSLAGGAAFAPSTRGSFETSITTGGAP